MTAPLVHRDEFRIVNSYAVLWVKQRLRALYREARTAGRPSPLKQTDAFLYLLAATYLRDGHLITDPIPLAGLHPVMSCEPDAVRKAKKRLVALGELTQVEGGQGIAHVRLKFRKISGALFDVDVGDVATPGTRTRHVPLATFTRPPAAPLMDVSHFDPTKGSDAYFDPTKGSDFHPRDRSAGQLPFLESKSSTGDYVPPIKEEEVRTAASLLEQQVVRFAYWWRQKVRTHSDEAPSRLDLRRPMPVDQQHDGDVVRDLLREYSFEELQAMTIKAWTIENDGSFEAGCIARSNRSVRVIRRWAIFLFDEVGRAQRPRESAVAPEAKLWEAILERLRPRVDTREFEQWFEPCRVEYVCDGVVTMRAPSQPHQELLQTLRLRDGGELRLQEALEAAVAEVLPGHRVSFTSDPEVSTAEASKSERRAARPPVQGGGRR